MLALQQTGASKIMTQLKICVHLCVWINPVSVTMHCVYMCVEKVIPIRRGMKYTSPDLCKCI